MIDRTTYTITPYRYARNSVVVRCPSPDGFTTKAGRIAAKHGRYVHRAGGWVMSPGRARKFEQEYECECECGPQVRTNGQHTGERLSR